MVAGALLYNTRESKIEIKTLTQQKDSIAKAYTNLVNAETTTEITIDSSNIIKSYLDNHPIVINNINSNEELIDSLNTIINNIDTSLVKIAVVVIEDSLKFKGGTMFYEHAIKGFLLNSIYDFRVANIENTKIVYIDKIIKEPHIIDVEKMHLYAGLNVSPTGTIDVNILVIRPNKLSYELGYMFGNTYPMEGRNEDWKSWERLKIGVKYKIK